MLVLPQIPYEMRKNRREIVAMRGINYSDNLTDGDLADSENISARRYPYLATRRERVKQEQYKNATALTAWDKLVAVEGTKLLYDGDEVGTVTAGEKQFAVVNTKLVIWPDKVYLDLQSKTVKSLGAEAKGAGATFATNSMTIAWQSGGAAVDLTTLFKVGDAVTISGCTGDLSVNNRDIVIKDLTATKMTVSSNAFTAGTVSGAEVKIERRVPDMDYICESENRLWGCSSEKQTIYASSNGDPTNFFVYEGLSTDSYALAVGSSGKFTGCCKLGSTVLFWKETTLHKMLGSFPAEYSLSTYTLEGLKEGCAKSLQVINEVLFYMGLHGVYAYSGGTPSLISTNFGNRMFSDAVAGNDGDSYYLAVREGTKRHLFVYETSVGLWVREGALWCADFARIGKDLYMLTESGDVYLAIGEGDEKNMEWYAQFAPIYETTRSRNSTNLVETRKSHSKLSLRVQVPRGSYLVASVRCDGKPWREVGRITGGTEDSVPLRVLPERCDKFEVRLDGKGPCTILSMVREFFVDSEV